MAYNSPYLGWYSGDNKRLFELLSIFYNLSPDYVTNDMIEAIAGQNPSRKDVEFAYASIVAAACGLDVYENKKDRAFFSERFLPCFHLLDTAKYVDNPYYRNIKLENVRGDNWKFENRKCKPYEGFVFDDPIIETIGDNYKVTPCIGFFKNEYPYPAVLENGREWMTLMPNETNTSQEAIDNSHGKVLTYGLGLGYFAYMASQKPEVTSVTVVELSKRVIELFERYILPQFPNKDKIKIVCMDCFEYAETKMQGEGFDSVFMDIWHDPSDGVEPYLKMKEYEKLLPDATFTYWVEKTLKLYI